MRFYEFKTENVIDDIKKKVVGDFKKRKQLCR